MRKGLFITFEGPEGSGKTTQMALLSTYLLAQGHRVQITREPGGTRLAVGIRKLLLQGGDGLGSRAELFLYEADRAQHVEEILRPALRQKTIVLCDRYTDSTLAYQGYGRRLDRKMILALNAIATDGLKPDLTILLDVPVERGLEQAKRKKKRHDRLERAGLAFHRRVRQGFLTLAKKEPKRFQVIKQQNTINATQELIRTCVNQFLILS